MLALGIASVGFQGQGDETLVVPNVGADLDHECEVNALEDFHSSPDDIRRRPRTDPAEQAQGVEPLAQFRPGGCRFDAPDTQILEPHDDAPQTQVCGTRHGRSPARVMIASKLTYHLRVRLD
jgi:hypothetical protein